MSDQHSPLPWSLEGRFIKDANGSATFGDIEYYPLVEPADFPFIVRACNSHDELLAALKELREVAAAWCRVSMNHPGLPEELHAAVQQIGIADGFGVRAQAAIAKAEGR